MPLPPPPAEALTSNGKPTSAPAIAQAAGSSVASSADGASGTPASAASRLAATFEPMARMDSGVGPTHTSPASSTAWAKSAFSARNP